MSIDVSNASLRRDIVLGVLAVSLLAGPLWAAILHVNDPAHEYDRVEVTTTERHIEYVDGHLPQGEMLSEDVICAETTIDFRACTFENHLHGEPIPTGYYSTSPASVHRESARESGNYYAYVQLDDGVYEPTYVANDSDRRNDLVRIDMGLEPIDPDVVLERVSVSVDDDELPSAIAETARAGPTTTYEPVDVPATPIALEDGTYYRVYRTGDVDEPRAIEGHLSFALRYVAPVVGLLLAVSLATRFEVSVSYVGSDIE